MAKDRAAFKVKYIEDVPQHFELGSLTALVSLVLIVDAVSSLWT